jgi:hypothetical protein
MEISMSESEKTPFLSPRNVPLWMGVFLALVVAVMVFVQH